MMRYWLVLVQILVPCVNSRYMVLRPASAAEPT